MTDKEREYIRTLKSLVADFIRDKQPEDVSYYQQVWDWLDSFPTDSKIEQIKAELQKRLLKYDPDMTNAGRELQEVLAFIDSLPAESCLSECSFKEYLRGVFEANNGIENDPDLLIALHGQTLFELAQKELPDSPDFEAEWKWYVNSRKDDMRTNAVTMNVKEVALYFAKWGRKQVLTAKPSEELEEEIHRYFKELEKSDCVSNTRRLAKHFAEWQKQQDDELLAIAHFDGVQSGKEAERKEMMKNAVEAKVSFGQPVLLTEPIPTSLAKDGDKVKLIIIKDDD